MKNLFILFLIAGMLAACGNTKEVENKAAQSVAEAPKEEGPKLQRMPESNQTGASEGLDGTITHGSVGESESSNVETIEWLDFETAIDRNKENPKYIFVDVYTDWCGWCKKMDASTFVDPNVVTYMNTHFYAVKMDAEMKEAIAYNGQLYEYKQFNARAGYNTLAVGLLDSQMSFPSFVILDKKEVKKGKIMGYKTPSNFLMELKKYVK